MLALIVMLSYLSITLNGRHRTKTPILSALPGIFSNHDASFLPS